MLEYVWIIPLLPLLAAAWTGLAGDRLGEKAGLVACGAIFSALIVTLSVFISTTAATAAGYNPFPYHVKLFTWMEVAGISVSMGFLIDQLSMIMLLIVTLLGSVIFYYARGYMHGDKGYARFFSYLSLFAFSMLILVMADNFLLLFVGWEGVGLCSYLLIGYYFNEGWCADAGKKAFITNRIGDFGFLLASFLILGLFGTFDFTSVFHQIEERALAGDPLIIGGLVLPAIAFCLLIAATGKSAQIPLYVWLPDAMAGPTPVSALIHAATMVTAGIYLIVRTNLIFVLSPWIMHIVAATGAATALVAALIACTQTDIKKVLAYSTVSQLGYMFLALGVGAFSGAIFHVFTHAFFKGCLFLCAGSVIHAMHHEQDMRKMGGLKHKMPTTARTYWISTLAIAGIPPLAGFFSKDEILWNVVGQQTFGHTLLWAVGALTALLTAFYMFRSYYMTFEGDPRADAHAWDHAHESPRVMTEPLIFLATGAALVGLLGLPPWLTHLLHIDALTFIFPNFLAPIADAGNELLHHMGHHGWHPHFDSLAAQHAAEFAFAGISIAIAATGMFVAHKLYCKPDSASGDAALERVPGYALAQGKFFVDEVYEKTVLATVGRGAGRAVAGDRDVIDGKVIGTVVEIVRGMGTSFNRLQTGQVQLYAVGIVGGLLLFLVFGLAI